MAAASDLERVRQVLLGTEFESLLALRDTFEDDGKFAAHVAAVLTEAMRHRAGLDDSVAETLAPMIDQAIAGSINQDPHKLAESLYPIMGPAIRKSISETLQQMLDNFNQLLEQSLSPQAMRWRFDAWRTGRSYSEIALLATLDYQIEQIFLIHRETSLLIQHVFDELAERKDADMVSGMFSAIQDFIEDSFSVSEGDVLDTLKLGELTVVIQRGPQAILAAVVRGRVPDTLRESLQSTLENIHRLKRTELSEYDGDPSVFAETEDDLRSILDLKLKTEQEKGKRKIPWLALVAIAAGLAGFGYWEYGNQQVRNERNRLLDALDLEAGIRVMSYDMSETALTVEIMRDPDARDPKTIDHVLPVPAHFNEFAHVSLDSVIVERRADRILAPPAGVVFEIDDTGQLEVRGEAEISWVTTLEAKWPAVTGLSSIDLTSLIVRDPVQEAIDAVTSRIQSISFPFERQSTELDPGSVEIMDLADALNEVLRLAPDVRFDVIGYTDETGSQAINERLAQERAEALVAAVIGAGVSADRLEAFSSFEYEGAPALNERTVRILVQGLTN